MNCPCGHSFSLNDQAAKTRLSVKEYEHTKQLDITIEFVCPKCHQPAKHGHFVKALPMGDVICTAVF